MCEHYTKAPKCPKCYINLKDVYTFVKPDKKGGFYRCCPECDYHKTLEGKELEDIKERWIRLAKDDMLRTKPYRPTLEEIFSDDVFKYINKSIQNGWNDSLGWKDEFAIGFQFKIEWDTQEIFYNECNQYEGTYQYFKITYSDFENVVIDFMGKVSNYPIELVEVINWSNEFYQECMTYMDADE